jgi:hypothetical protein
MMATTKHQLSSPFTNRATALVAAVGERVSYRFF